MVPMRGVFLVGIVAAAVETSAAAGLGLRFNRPAESTWKRTQCGSPSGEHPAGMSLLHELRSLVAEAEDARLAPVWGVGA